MRRQRSASERLAPWRPPSARPPANMAALIAPALAALMPSNAMRSSSSNRSRTPQVKAPCAPPPCRARLIDLISTLGGHNRERLVCGPITTLPSILTAPRRGSNALQSGACRSRRNVRSGIDRRKCRLAIMQMCACYRARRRLWRAVGHGDTPGPLFPRALRDLEFHARGGALQCLTASLDSCRAQAGGGARRSAAAARAQPDASDRFRTTGPSASRADDGRCRGGQIDSEALPPYGQRANQSRRDVFGRTDPLYELPRRVPLHASGLRCDARRRRPWAACRTA